MIRLMLLSTLVLLIIALLIPDHVRAQDELPRVLILGDSIYNGPARELSKELKGQVTVVYRQLPPGEPFNSHTANENLDELVGEEHWDLIHFNVGLGDLVYRVPGLQSFRALSKNAGGVRNTSPEDYVANLKNLVTALAQTEAKLVWASTTPIRHSSTALFVPGSELEYNRLAAEVMTARNIVINDMYANMASVIDLDRPTSFDPFSLDKKPLHPYMAKVIRRELTLAKQGSMSL